MPSEIVLFPIANPSGYVELTAGYTFTNAWRGAPALWAYLSELYHLEPRFEQPDAVLDLLDSGKLRSGHNALLAATTTRGYLLKRNFSRFIAEAVRVGPAWIEMACQIANWTNHDGVAGVCWTWNSPGPHFWTGSTGAALHVVQTRGSREVFGPPPDTRFLFRCVVPRPAEALPVAPADTPHMIECRVENGNFGVLRPNT